MPVNGSVEWQCRMTGQPSASLACTFRSSTRWHSACSPSSRSRTTYLGCVWTLGRLSQNILAFSSQAL
jgi:hypothetical protein